MNRFREYQGRCRANLRRWGLAQSPSRDCGQRQTMNDELKADVLFYVVMKVMFHNNFLVQSLRLCEMGF